MQCYSGLTPFFPFLPVADPNSSPLRCYDGFTNKMEQAVLKRYLFFKFQKHFMTKPRIFISCVSTELKTVRQSVANALIGLGYEPVWQEIFETAPGELLKMLREKIDSCSGLVQLVGQAYGAEPPVATEEFGRVSYTQYEFLYAQKKGKLTWLIPIGDDCTKDANLEQLDIPKPEPRMKNLDSETSRTYQAERRELQSAYLEALKSDNHLRHWVNDDKDLEIKILKLRDELLELRRKSQIDTKRLLTISLVTLVLVAAVGVGGFFVLKTVRQNTALTVEKLELQEASNELKGYSSVPLGEESFRKSLTPEEEKKLRIAAWAREKGTTVEEAKAKLDESAKRAIADPRASNTIRAIANLYFGNDAEAEKVAGNGLELALAQDAEKRAEIVVLATVKGKAQLNQANSEGAILSLRTACKYVDRSDPILWTDTHAQLAVATRLVISRSF